MSESVNIDYSKMIGDREVQIEVLRIVIKQKDDRIKELEERLDSFIKKDDEEEENVPSE